MIVVALDGPSGSGKSSTSKAIAIRAGWNYLDTGALYRAMTFLALSIKSENPKDIEWRNLIAPLLERVEEATPSEHWHISPEVFHTD